VAGGAERPEKLGGQSKKMARGAERPEKLGGQSKKVARAKR
jgi:hypothetical protein